MRNISKGSSTVINSIVGTTKAPRICQSATREEICENIINLINL